MADPKNYFEFLDLADESRWYVRDAEAQAAIANLPSAASIQTCESIIDELT